MLRVPSLASFILMGLSLLAGCGSKISFDDEFTRNARDAAFRSIADARTSIDDALNSQWEPQQPEPAARDRAREFDREIELESGRLPQFVAALDRNTGALRWKRDRDGDHSYSTPLLIEHAGIRQIVSLGGRGVASYEPATGQEFWWCRHDGHSVVPRPVYGNGFIYICTGYNVPQLLAIDPTGERDVTDSHIAWQSERGVPFNASPILVDKQLYLVNDVGVLSCYGAEDGGIRWQKRLRGHFSASPVLADGRLYLLNDEGTTYVVTPGSEFQLEATNTLDGYFQASPAITGRSIILRSETQLIRIEEPAEEGAGEANVAHIDWPQFRGPDGQGHAGDDLGVPLQWDDETNVVWKTEIPGRGWSSPVVKGNQIWLTTSIEKDDGSVILKAICVSRDDGSIMHDVDVFRKSDPGPIHRRSSHATPTPAIDGNFVVVHFGAHGTAGLTADGQILWRTRIAHHHHHGPAGSPIIVDDMVVLNCDGYDGPYDEEGARARGESEPEPLEN